MRRASVDDAPDELCGSASGGRELMPWGRADTGSPDLAEAYRQHREEIYRYLFGKTHDREQAEDLTQEVFTAALVARPTLAGDSGSLLPWLYVVARRRYIDSRRHNLTTGTLCVPLDMAHAVPARVPMLEGAALVDALVEAIRGLPAAQRRVCLMRLFEGRSYSEIQHELSATEVACRMQFNRAMTALRRALESAGSNPFPLTPCR
jgi:RNA polymerase sigma-70 factor (ECF subfamily)